MDLNHRHAALEAAVLPTELIPQEEYCITGIGSKARSPPHLRGEPPVPCSLRILGGGVALDGEVVRLVDGRCLRLHRTLEPHTLR
jgi:hypothetical protein